MMATFLVGTIGETARAHRHSCFLESSLRNSLSTLVANALAVAMLARLSHLGHLVWKVRRVLPMEKRPLALQIVVAHLLVAFMN